MIRIAFFVEGQTERIFLENLLNVYFTHPNFNIQSDEIRGGRVKTITHINYENNIKYYFLIFDVGGDGSLTGAILERAKSLIEKHNYNHIFGIRDLFPFEKSQLEKIKNRFNYIIEKEEISNETTLIIAVMEIETWFLAENSFFQKINEELTVEKINNALNIDIVNDDLEDIKHPAKTLDDIFKIIGKKYKKRTSDTYSICSKLDYSEFILNQNLRYRIPSFDNFVNKLSEF